MAEQERQASLFPGVRPATERELAAEWVRGVVRRYVAAEDSEDAAELATTLGDVIADGLEVGAHLVEEDS